MSYETRADDTAYAHKDDVLMVFEHDAVWVNGTAIRVESDPNATRGVFWIGPNHYRTPTVRGPHDDAATFTTTCARCAAPLEATDTAIKAHEPRCLIVGDHVRWDGVMDDGEQVDCWVQGEIVWVPTGGRGHIGVRVSASSDRHFAAVVNLKQYTDAGIPILRRIPRPEQAVAHRDVKPENVPTAPLDVKYDGLTAEQCLERFLKSQREVLHRTYAKLWLTAPQLAAARDLWSAQLRERVAASKERERLSVMTPDLELETANCKDAE